MYIDIDIVLTLTLIAEEIVPIGLALIVYEHKSMLTLIANKIVQSFDIESKVKLSCTWIDTGLRTPYGVGYLLHQTWRGGGTHHLTYG